MSPCTPPRVMRTMSIWKTLVITLSCPTCSNCYLFSNLGKSKSNVFTHSYMMDFIDQDLAIYILHLLDNPWEITDGGPGIGVMYSTLGLNPLRQTHNNGIYATHASFPQHLPLFTLRSLVDKWISFNPPGWLHCRPPFHELLAIHVWFHRRYDVLLFALDPMWDLRWTALCRQVLHATFIS